MRLINKTSRDIWDDEPPLMIRVFRQIRRLAQINNSNIKQLADIAINYSYCYYIIELNLNLNYHTPVESIISRIESFVYQIDDVSRLNIRINILSNNVNEGEIKLIWKSLDDTEGLKIIKNHIYLDTIDMGLIQYCSGGLRINHIEFGNIAFLDWVVKFTDFQYYSEAEAK